MEGVGTAASLALSSQASSFDPHFDSDKTETITTEVTNEDTFLKPLTSRATGIRGLRPLTLVLVIASVAMTTFIILHCLRTMRRASKSTPEGKRGLAVGGEGGNLPECSAGGNTLPPPLTTEQARAYTSKARDLKERLLTLKNPPGGPADFDQAALESAVMDSVTIVSQGQDVEFGSAVDESTQQALQEELQGLVAAASAGVELLSEDWIQMLQLRTSLLPRSITDLQGHAGNHSARHPPQSFSMVVTDMLEMRGRVTVAREICEGLGRFTQPPFQQAQLSGPIGDLQARATEVENAAREILDSLLEMWKTRLTTLREAVTAGTKSQADLEAAEEEAKSFVEAVNAVSGFSVSLE
ncbi:hypothetical protein Emed_007495 [Eimeria media]